MLKLFSLTKRFLRGGPEGCPGGPIVGQGGGPNLVCAQLWPPLLEIGLIRACLLQYYIKIYIMWNKCEFKDLKILTV